MKQPSYHILHIYSANEKNNKTLMVELNYKKVRRLDREYLAFKTFNNDLFYVDAETYEVSLNTFEEGFNDLSELYLVAIDKDLTEFGRKHSQ
ncbi:hypothetical protein NQ624_17850, partial [Acinetobacter baumannii]|nr:hypothetical protein [Acinetobacter baumannii]